MKPWHIHVDCDGDRIKVAADLPAAAVAVAAVQEIAEGVVDRCAVPSRVDELLDDLDPLPPPPIQRRRPLWPPPASAFDTPRERVVSRLFAAAGSIELARLELAALQRPEAAAAAELHDQVTKLALAVSTALHELTRPPTTVADAPAPTDAGR